MTASKPETSAIGHAKQVRPTRRRSPASLALRVTALIGAAITLVFLCFQWAIVRSLEHHFAQQDAHELDAVISALAEPLRQGDDMDRDALGQQLANAVAGHHGMSYAVYDQTGNTIYATAGPDLSKMNLAPSLWRRSTPRSWRCGRIVSGPTGALRSNLQQALLRMRHATASSLPWTSASTWNSSGSSSACCVG